MKSAYMRFLTLLAKIEQGSDIHTLDEVSKRLLDTIAMRHAAGSSLTVTEAMALNTLSSPATIHRKLDQLSSMGFIEVEFREGNRRSKYLVLSPTSIKHYEKLGSALIDALKKP